MKSFMDRDVAKVWIFGSGTVAALDWSTVEIIIKCLIGLTVLGYTARKWWFAEKDRKAGKPFGTTFTSKDDL